MLFNFEVIQKLEKDETFLRFFRSSTRAQLEIRTGDECFCWQKSIRFYTFGETMGFGRSHLYQSGHSLMVKVRVSSSTSCHATIREGVVERLQVTFVFRLLLPVSCQ